MPSDSEIISSINQLLLEDDENKERSRGPLISVPLPVIIPAGSGEAIARDGAGNIVGIKLAAVGLAAPAIISKICELSHLERLVFVASRAVDIPPEIQHLKHLKYIELRGSIKSVPESLFTLDLPLYTDGRGARTNELSRLINTLSTLEFSKDKDASLREPPEDVFVKTGELTESLAEEVLNFRGFFLELHDLEDPPREIVERGRGAIMRYFRERGQADLPLNELKVILVGNGGAGKTLTRRGRV